MLYYYYKFSDGYILWSAGRLSKSEKTQMAREHGSLLIETKKCI